MNIINGEKLMKNNPLVSVIITSLDRKELLRQTLDMLAKQTYTSLEIIVVHSGEDRKIPIMLKKCYPDVRLIKLPHRLPDSPARNIGVANANGEYILFLDDDSFPSHNSISKAVNEFEHNYLSLGVISFQIKMIDKISTRCYNNDNITRHPYGYQLVYGFSGCGGMMSKSLFDKYGSMPETGQESMFEHTVCLWAWNEELDVRSYNDIFVYHHLSNEGKAAELRECKSAMYAGALVTGLFAWQYFSGRELWSRMIRWWYQCTSATIMHLDYKFIWLAIHFLLTCNKYPTYRGQFSKDALSKVRLTNNFKGK